MPHKSYVVIKALEIPKSLVEQLLRALCGLEVVLVLCLVVETVIESAPEAGGPAAGIDALVHTVFVNAVCKLIS